MRAPNYCVRAGTARPRLNHKEPPQSAASTTTICGLWGGGAAGA